MIIPFWSTHHGQSRVTCNMMCVSIMTVLNYKVRAIMTQGHYNLNNLEGPFLGYTQRIYERDFLGETGFGALFKSFKSEPLTQNVIEESVMKILQNRLSLLPGHYIGNMDMFRYDMINLLPTVLEKIDEYYDYVFIDTPSGKNEISEVIMKESDYIVVCLNQSPGVIDSFFEKYEEIWKNRKVFYIIGDYDCNSIYNYKYILKKYPEIKFKNSSVIPYNTAFRDSLPDASTVDFFINNKKEYLDKMDKCYFFMLEVEATTNKLMNMVGENRNR